MITKSERKEIAAVIWIPFAIIFLLALMVFGFRMINGPIEESLCKLSGTKSIRPPTKMGRVMFFTSLILQDFIV